MSNQPMFALPMTVVIAVALLEAHRAKGTLPNAISCLFPVLVQGHSHHLLLLLQMITII